jgi:hypothetical protein
VDGDDGSGAGYLSGLGEALGKIVAEVALVEGDYGGGSAFGGEGEIAFQAAEVEIAIEAANEEDEIDVGGEGLLIFAASGGAACEEGAAGEDGFDDGLSGADDAGGDPIADHGHSGAGGCGVPEKSGGFGIELAGIGKQMVLVALRKQDAGKDAGRGDGGTQFRGGAKEIETLRLFGHW